MNLHPYSKNIVNKTANLAFTHLNTQTILVCALACEAKPLIDYFKLKKIASVHAFSLYQLGSIHLIVTGIGQSNMAAGVNWLSGYFSSQQTQFWLNVGVAGHASADVGSLFCVHKMSYQQHNLYPTKWLKHKVNLAPLVTNDHEESLYQQSTLYDMEGFAFYQAAVRFNSQECVQCLKVVSDNQQQAISRDKTFISNVIAKQCDDIVAFISLHTSALEVQLFSPALYDDFKATLMAHIHFSHSQQLQLDKLLQAAQSHEADLNSLAFTNDAQAKSVLNTIKNHLDNLLVAL